MSIQGNTATLPRRPAARPRPYRDLAKVRDEPGWMPALLAVFLVTLFIPKAVAVDIGSITLTPALGCSIVLFPALLLGNRIRPAWPDVMVLLFYAATIYSTVMSASVAESVETSGRRVLLGVVPYLVGRYLGSRPQPFQRFMRIIMSVMAVFAVFLLVESIFRFNIHAELWGQPYDPHHERRLGLTRAYGWTSHSIMLGVSYAVFVPVMAIAAIERLNHLGSFRWLKLGLLLVGVFCSLSTGAWLPAVIAIGLVVWDYLKFLTPAQRWLCIGVGAPLMYLILEVLSGRPLLRILMMELHLSSPTAWYYRWELYQRVYSVMPGYEWFGHGIKIPTLSNAWQWSIDNNYLVVLMQYGRVGLAIWIGLAVSVLVYGWKAVWNAPDTPYRRVARAVMFAIATVGLTQLSVALFSTAAMLNWLFLGLAVGMAQGLGKRPGKRRGPGKPKPRRRRKPPAPPSQPTTALPAETLTE